MLNMVDRAFSERFVRLKIETIWTDRDKWLSDLDH
jgi:hypothetical protein